MINAKAIYSEMLENEGLLALVDSGSIFDSYPSEIENFPCICYIDRSQFDIEYADNSHTFQRVTVEVHIYTKALEGYPTTSEIGIKVAEIFNSDFWFMKDSAEVGDPVEDVRHRVMTFSKDIFIEQ